LGTQQPDKQRSNCGKIVKGIYKNFFSRALEPMLVMNLQGQIVEVNPSAAKLFGINPSDQAGHQFKDFLPELVVEKFHEKLGLLEFSLSFNMNYSNGAQGITWNFQRETNEHLYSVKAQWIFLSGKASINNYEKEAQCLSLSSTFLYDPNSDHFVFAQNTHLQNSKKVSSGWHSLQNFLEQFPLEQQNFINLEFMRSLNEKVQVELESQIQVSESETSSWVKITLDPVFENGTTPYLLGIIQNIDKMKKIQLKLMNSNIELQRQRMFLQTLLDKLPMAISCQSVDLEFHFTHWNKTAELVFGKKSSEMLGKNRLEIENNEESKLAFERDKEILKSNEIHQINELEWKKNGKDTQWLRAWKIPINNILSGERFLASIHLDITESKLRQESLIESRDLYFTAIKNSKGGLWDWNLETNELEYSSHFKKLLGYENDLVKSTLAFFKSLINPSDRVRVYQIFLNQLRAKQAFECEFRLLSKNGDYRWFLGRGQALWVNDQAVRMIGTIIDIHQLKTSQQSQAVKKLLKAG
jgi:PAS domain S-box-containing protein